MIGPEAPSPQTRAFQNVYGGLSIANGPARTAPVIACDAAAARQIGAAPRARAIAHAEGRLRPGIGIFVARVTGSAGCSAARRRACACSARCRSGRAKKGRNRFRWNGRVNGRRLGRGTYLLTYRSLKGKTITSTSDSLRFKIAKGGKIRQVRRERPGR